MKLINYIDQSGHDRFQKWFDALRDRAGRVATQRRLDQLARATPVTASSAGTGYGNYELIPGRATACITRKPGRRSFSYSLAAASRRNHATSHARSIIGMTIKPAYDYETYTT